MTDYIKQVAEAVRDACDDIAVCYRNRVDIQAQIIKLELDPIISSVPKPEPVGWKYRERVWALGIQGYVWREKIESDYPELGQIEGLLPVYAYPPDAQAEIDRLKAESAKREAFIDELVKQRHAELSLAVNLGWEESGEGWNDEYCPDRAKAISDRVAIVAKIEQERGE